jgi:flagellar motor switch protein FliN/FliY
MAGEESESLGQDDIEALLRQAQSGVEEAAGGTPADPTNEQPESFQFGELEPQEDEAQPAHSLEMLGDVELDLRIELGRTHMRLEEVLQLRSGAVVVLDKLAGDPVDIFVNGRLVARGEVLVMNDNFCIRVTELVGSAAA